MKRCRYAIRRSTAQPTHPSDPAASAGAVVGAGLGAQHEHVDPLDISPWVLIGPAVEVAGAVVALTAAAGSFLAATSPASGAPIDPNVFVAAGTVGILAFLAGPPITVLTVYATAPDNARTTAAAATTTAAPDPR